MAKNHGPIQLSGTIGELTFYRTRNGFFVRQKSSSPGKSLESSARQQAQRAAFGDAMRAANTVRHHLLPFIGMCKSSDMRLRLNRLLLQAAHLYKITPREECNGSGLVLSLLQGFEFNNTTSLFTALHASIESSFDRDTGLASVSVGAFVAEAVLKYMAGVTHMRISIAAAAINFTTREAQKQFLDGDYLPVGQQPAGALTLSVSLPPNLADPVLLLLKLQYFQEVNGDMQERYNASCCTCTVLRIIS
jgi:hypothetical protein